MADRETIIITAAQDLIPFRVKQHDKVSAYDVRACFDLLFWLCFRISFQEGSNLRSILQVPVFPGLPHSFTQLFQVKGPLPGQKLKGTFPVLCLLTHLYDALRQIRNHQNQDRTENSSVCQLTANPFRIISFCLLCIQNMFLNVLFFRQGISDDGSIKYDHQKTDHHGNQQALVHYTFHRQSLYDVHIFLPHPFFIHLHPGAMQSFSIHIFPGMIL